MQYEPSSVYIYSQYNASVLPKTLNSLRILDASICHPYTRDKQETNYS